MLSQEVSVVWRQRPEFAAVGAEWWRKWGWLRSKRATAARVRAVMHSLFRACLEEAGQKGKTITRRKKEKKTITRRFVK